MNWQQKKKQPPMKIAFSLKEVAEMMGLSVGHLRNEEKRGRLNFTKSGRRTLVTNEELKRYIAVCSPPGTQLPLFR
jgi:excisionase family DNA binding protein